MGTFEFANQADYQESFDWVLGLNRDNLPIFQALFLHHLYLGYFYLFYFFYCFNF